MDKPLFIFEMANNHSGSVEHGIKIMEKIKEKCVYPEFDYAFKFQYRNLDTFIHKDYKNDMSIKQIKRFSETRLSDEQFLMLKNKAEELGFITICTPFDEDSVEKVVEQGYKYLKIASCSFTDWSLLEKIAQYDLPIIASTASATLSEIDNVVSFFKHRNKKLSLMCCVAEYPTQDKNLQLNQIDLFRSRYPDIPVGYSTHENPDNELAVAIAIGKGAAIFEKHVGVATENISLNGYSANPEQVGKWLENAHNAYLMCGTKNSRPEPTQKELDDLHTLRRAVFASHDLKKGDFLSFEDAYFALPAKDNQLVVNDMDKYSQICLTNDIKADSPVMFGDVKITNTRDIIFKIYQDIAALLKKANIAIAPNSVIEISHHYGVENFYKCGTTIIECINREYCKKILVQLPKQDHPIHLHKVKEETFQVLYGDIYVTLNGVEKRCVPGDIITVERGIEHSFRSENGGIFEEVSSTHYKDDSYYKDQFIMNNKHRKTQLKFFKEWDV